MKTDDMQRPRGPGFFLGMVTGSLAGLGLMMYLAPRVTSEIRQRMMSSTGRLRDQAARQARMARTRISTATGEMTRAGRDARNAGAEAVARSAHEVERVARAVQSPG